MEFFKTETNIDFMAIKSKALLFSGFLFAVSLIAILINGLNLGLDFTGGTQYEFKLNEYTTIDQIRSQLANTGFDDALVQSAGGQKQALIRTGIQPDQSPAEQKQQIQQALKC